MLIDTKALIWYAHQPQLLSQRAVGVIRNKGNFYSWVSLWEIAIKSSLGKLRLQDANGRRVDAKQFLLRLIRDLDLSTLPLEFDDFAAVETLPFHHRDPFDRLLAVQAKRANLPIVSADQVFEQYGIKRVW
jgi:PIN domain nuclease of toxin-antitoxin system